MKLFKTLASKLVASAAIVAVVAGVTSVAIAGFGPDRATKQYAQPMSGFDHPQFNSFVGVPNVGDERDFLRGVVAGRDSQWADPVNNVAQDAEVEAKIYIHNNADIQYNVGDKKGVAKNVTVKVELPSGAKQAHDIRATIAADNAQPQSIFDTLSLTGLNSGFFELEPIAGSGKLFRNGTQIGTVDVNQLISGTGVNIGDQEGCFEQIREITFKLKVKMPHYTVSKLVRLEGQTKADWKESIQAQPGQMLEYKIEFDNIGRTLLNDVVIVDDLPAGMVAEQNSVKLYDGNFPNGTPFNNDVIQKNGTQINAKIGNVNAGINSIVFFKARVPALDKLKCGVNTLVNAGYATPNGYHTIKDEATVSTKKECTEPEKPTYVCQDVKIDILSGRKVKVTVTASGSPANRVSIKNYEYNYGDGKTALVTDKNVTEYTYDKDGTYKVSVKVTFAVDGVNQTVSGDACAEVVTLTSTPEEKCPYNNTLAKNDPKCEKPKELPNTGAGSMIGLFGAVTAAGMFITRRAALRK